MQERRLTVRLESYWNFLRKDAEIPDITRLNSAAIEDLWPYCSRLGLAKSAKQAFIYDYVGEKIIAIYGDLTGRQVGAKSVRQGPVKYQLLHQSAIERKPLSEEGHFLGTDNRIHKYRACVLPFGNSKRGITHMVVGMSYPIF